MARTAEEGSYGSMAKVHELVCSGLQERHSRESYFYQGGHAILICLSRGSIHRQLLVFVGVLRSRLGAPPAMPQEAAMYIVCCIHFYLHHDMCVASWLVEERFQKRWLDIALLACVTCFTCSRMHGAPRAGPGRCRASVSLIMSSRTSQVCLSVLLWASLGISGLF